MTNNNPNIVIALGTVFDTPFENGCVAVEAPDDLGNFVALDSDGVECLFFIDMVTKTYD